MEEKHIGEKYGKLLIVKRAEDSNSGKRRYECLCDCGNTKIVAYGNLRNGHTKSCGCLRIEKTAERGRATIKDFIGQKFGFLTVIRRVENYVSPKGSSKIMYECRCDCGNMTVVHKGSLARGDTISCGCMQRALNGRAHKMFNRYDLSGEYGIGYDTNNKEFYFDKEDYDKIKDYRWQVGDEGYVTSTDRNRNFANVKFHRLILGLYPGNSHILVDHIHGAQTRNDNRKDNLRIVTPSQNGQNRNIKSTNTSGVTGVTKSNNKWRAYITLNYKRIDLGTYELFEDAVNARQEAEDQYFGEYSYRNSQVRD